MMGIHNYRSQRTVNTRTHRERCQWRKTSKCRAFFIGQCASLPNPIGHTPQRTFIMGQPKKANTLAVVTRTAAVKFGLSQAKNNNRLYKQVQLLNSKTEAKQNKTKTGPSGNNTGKNQNRKHGKPKPKQKNPRPWMAKTILHATRRHPRTGTCTALPSRC